MVEHFHGFGYGQHFIPANCLNSVPPILLLAMFNILLGYISCSIVKETYLEKLHLAWKTIH